MDFEKWASSDWLRGVKIGISLVGTVAVVSGTFLGILAYFQSVDYSHNIRVESVKLEFAKQAATEEKKIEFRKKKSEEYENQIQDIKRRIVELESKIEKIDPSTLIKDSKSGILVSGETLMLTKEVMAGLESLNKEVMRLPPDLAVKVNAARYELIHRHSSKIFSKAYGDPKDFQPNFFYLRDFDEGTTEALQNYIQNGK